MIFRSTLFVYAIAAYALVLTILRFNTWTSQSRFEKENDRHSKIIAAYKRCILSTETEFEARLTDTIERCSAQLLCVHSYKKYSTSWVGVFDSKNFIPPNAEFDGSGQMKCIWLTIGIGGVTHAEMEFKKRYPHCEIIGIDPYQFGNFSLIGKVIPYGIGKTPKNVTFSTGTPNAMLTTYTLTFEQIIEKYFDQRVIYFATLDTEGFEYDVLKYFIKDRANQPRKLIVCQIDTEFHSDYFRKRTVGTLDNDIRSYWKELLEGTPYIPIYAYVYGAGSAWANKITLVDVVNTECRSVFDIEKYIFCA